MKNPIKTAYLTALIFVLSCLFSVSASAADGGGVSVSSADLSAGMTFTVSVIVPPAPNADTASIEVNFSASAFEVTEWSPSVPGGIINSGDGFFVVAAANASRSIDLSQGLELKATLRVKSDAADGSYAFILTRHSLSYYSEDGNEHTDLWNPITSKAEVTVKGSASAAAQALAANDDDAETQESEAAATTTAATTTTEAATTTAETTTTTTTAAKASAEEIKVVPSAGDTTKPADYGTSQKGSPTDTATPGKRVNPHTGAEVAIIIPAVFSGCAVFAGKSLNRRKRKRKYIDDEEDQKNR